MSTIAPVTPFAARIDLATATDAELFIEYTFFADQNAEYWAEGNERTDSFGRREDSYAKAIKASIWDRGYDAAYAAAVSHPTIHSHDEAQAVADAAVTEMLELGNAWKYASKCSTGHTIAGMAAKAAVSKAALDEVHRGLTVSNAGGNRHTEKSVAANRRIHATDPHEYGFDAARTVSADGLSYDMTAVEDAIDQERFGVLTENEAAVEWFVETVTQDTGISRGDALAWLHTTGLTNEVEEYIDLVAEVGSHEEAGRLADQRRFPVKDVAAIIGTSIRTAERRIKTARSATYSDCTLTGALRSGSVGTRHAEVNEKTLAFALTTSLEAHAAQAGQTLTVELLAAVPDSFFADYIAEYMADGTVAADIEPALIAEMRAAAEAVAA